MTSNLMDLAAARAADRTAVGGKAVGAGRAVRSRISGAARDGGDRHGPRQSAPRRAACGCRRRLRGNRFAVRSSGAAEALPDASYAGLYETYLNVPADGLREAVRQCFAATSERVTIYRDRHKGVTAAMTVLVQVMVDPVAAGVAFTAHPVTGGF